MSNHKINPDDIFLALVWAFLAAAIVLGGALVAFASDRGKEAEARQTMNAAHVERVMLGGGAK